MDTQAASDEAKEKGLIEEVEATSEDEFNLASGLANGGSEVICPATVYQVSGASVRGQKTNSMIFSQMGVFIVGETGNKGAEREVSRIIPWEQVAYIDYNFELLDKLLAKP